MAAQTQPYVVRRGDYLTAIAHSHGLKPDDVWKAPNNATLRKLRKNPEMLAPGDVLYLPAVDRKWLPVTVGQANSFVVNLPKVEIHVVLKDAAGKPFAGKVVHLEPRVTPKDPSTDGSGLLKVDVPVTLRVLSATVVDVGVTFALRVGHLDPHDRDSGALSRLRQLGYVGDEGGLLATGRPYLDGFDATASTLARAVAAFQQDLGQPVTGAIDDSTSAKLHDAYGY
jgi:N-acetylmuramoyl-L-alanine amidase